MEEVLKNCAAPVVDSRVGRCAVETAGCQAIILSATSQLSRYSFTISTSALPVEYDVNVLQLRLKIAIDKYDCHSC